MSTDPSLDGLLAFAWEHRDDDPVRLLLQTDHYPDVDLRQVAQQIEGLRQARGKWPSLAEESYYLFPPRLNREQSSSEATARYKAQLVERIGAQTLADLTGGMGVDTAWMARQVGEVHYCEQDEALCRMAQHNFGVLRLPQVECHTGNSIEWLSNNAAHYDLLYIDPARRDERGRKVAAFEDCSPPLLSLLPLIGSHCQWLLVKASPMIDLRLAVRQLGRVAEVHVVAVQGECKEVLFLRPSEGTVPQEPLIYCVDLDRQGAITCEAPPHFTFADETSAVPRYATHVGQFLFEPHAALMKGGCFNSICQWYGAEKLAPHTHLYTSDQPVAHFPGRTFRILQALVLNARTVAEALPDGKAHVLTRNYPMRAEQLQKKLKLQEGGDLFVVAATVGTRPQGWLCQRV